MEKKKQNKKDLLTIILVILLLLIGVSVAQIFRHGISDNIIDLGISESQETINYDINHHNNDSDYTELMGFGCLDINKDYPFAYLINPEGNEVYLSFDVYEDDKLLYSSKLIEPGMMEQFNAYDCLNAGRHNLIYSITSYDLGNKSVLWSNIRQNQELLIVK